jgi:hypothetical protein
MTTFQPETTPKGVISCVRQMEVAGVVKVIEPVEADETTAAPSCLRGTLQPP